MTTRTTDPDVERLARQGARLTRQLTANAARHDELARERADVWRDALARGATHRVLADEAGLHHSQIAKAIDRYGGNGQ